MINSNRKGKCGEREAAKAIQHYLGFEARRGQQFKGGQDSPDVALDDVEGLHFEVKRVERLELYKALEQALVDAGENAPIVLHRKNHKPWVAVIRLEDLAQVSQIIVDGLQK